MISEFKQLENLFEKIDGHLKKNINIYVIGGVVLLYHGLKPSTKDIDIITENRNDYIIFESTLKSIGFKSKNPTGIYKKLNLGAILEKDDYRIDVFDQIVCKKFSLSKEIKNRANGIISYKHLKVFLCSNEDIFILKSLTEREGDLEDCISLVKQGINWNTILEEIISQIQTSGQGVWITWIGERFDILGEKGIKIPIMDEINKIREQYFDNLERKYKEN